MILLVAAFMLLTGLLAGLLLLPGLSIDGAMAAAFGHLGRPLALIYGAITTCLTWATWAFDWWFALF